MFKKSNAKWVLGLLVIPALLAGCSKTDLPIEDPEVVLKNSLTYPMEAYEANMVMNVDLSDESTKQSGDMVFEFNEKGEMSGETMIAEVLMKMSADLAITSPTSETPESMMVNAEGSFVLNGQDMFAELNRLEVEGEHSEVATIQGFLPMISPYLNQTFYIDLEAANEMNSELAASTPTANLSTLSQQEMMELRNKMAEVELLKVSKENGIKKITTIGGEKVPAYHYDIEFQPENIDEFLNAINDIDQSLDEEEKALIEGVFEKLNEKVQFEMWIGQEDYFPYKTAVTIETFNMKEVVDYMFEAQDVNVEMSEAEAEELENLMIDLSLVTENQPLDSVDIEVPNKDEATDLIKMLEGMMNTFMGGASLDFSSTSTDVEAMTDEEINAMMEGISDEELDAMMEEFNIN